MRIIFFASICFCCINSLSAQDIRLYHDINYSLNFNRQVPVGFEIVTQSGQHLSTKGYLKGKVRWNQLDIDVTGGRIKKGMLYIDSATKAIDQQKLKFDVFYKKKNIRKTLFLEMKYDGLQVAEYKPRQGKAGKSRGSRFIGKIWFIVLSGKTGKNGSKGADGPHLKVLLEMRKIDVSDVLVATVINKETKQQGVFMIDPSKGHLLISADGGKGGDGGDGGDGVDDKNSPSSGGNGGDGARGGNGGSIEVVVNDIVRPYLHCLRFSTNGGAGGEGGTGGEGGMDDNGNRASKGSSGSSGVAGMKGPDVYYTNATDTK
jgi:hypothetical protein